MKKNYLSSRRTFAFMLLFVVFIFSCRKESAQKTTSTEQNSKEALSVANAKAYLDSALKKNSTTIKIFSTESNSTPTIFSGYLFWDKAKAFLNKRFEVVEVPLALDYKETSFYKLGGDTSAYVTDKAVAEAAFTRALIYRDSAQKIIDRRIITYIPDKSYLVKNPDPSANNWLNSMDKKFSGYIEYRNWGNEVNMVVRILAGKVVHVYNVSAAPNNDAAGVKTQGLKTNDLTCITYLIPSSTTVTSVSGIYSVHFDGGRYCTICSSSSDDDNFNHNRPPMPPADWQPVYGQVGGGGGSSSSSSPTVSDEDIANATYVDNGKPPIDPSKYIKCFTDGKTASQYKLTLYVDQPVHGQNDTWALSGYGEKFTTVNGISFDVGHAFVGFQKINTDGTSVTQVIGFYPNPSSPVADGVIKDDSGHSFDVSYTATVNSSQFLSALTGVIYDNGFSKYILTANIGYGSEYNCVDAARTWMLNAGVNLPISTNRGAFLNSPGDYGQALGKFNGASTTSGNAPNSHGPCN